MLIAIGTILIVSPFANRVRTRYGRGTNPRPAGGGGGKGPPVVFRK